MVQAKNKKTVRKSKPKNKATAVAKRSFSRRIRESDGQYLLKLSIVVVLGTVWIKFGQAFYLGNLALTGVPVGMIGGMILVERFETLQENRKIWYAILVLTAIASYFLPAGIVI